MRPQKVLHKYFVKQRHNVINMIEERYFDVTFIFMFYEKKSLLYYV